MKMTDINKKFTEYVAEYIAKGFILSETMAGHQGEINKVDLVKGNQLIRVWLNRELAGNWMDDAFHGDKVVLRVGLWNREYNPRKYNDIVWMNDLHVQEEISFYEIKRNHWFVETQEEAKRCQDIRRSRYIESHRSNYQDITSERTQEIGVKYLKNHEGYKRVSKDAIRIKKYVGSESHISYKLYYKSNYYVIG